MTPSVHAEQKINWQQFSIAFSTRRRENRIWVTQKLRAGRLDPDVATELYAFFGRDKFGPRPYWSWLSKDARIALRLCETERGTELDWIRRQRAAWREWSKQVEGKGLWREELRWAKRQKEAWEEGGEAMEQLVISMGGDKPAGSGIWVERGGRAPAAGAGMATVGESDVESEFSLGKDVDSHFSLDEDVEMEENGEDTGRGSHAGSSDNNGQEVSDYDEEDMPKCEDEPVLAAEPASPKDSAMAVDLPFRMAM